jgi:hypothetical protein
MAQEAIASVALSHQDDCDCVICRAAGGDKDALAEVLLWTDSESPYVTGTGQVIRNVHSLDQCDGRACVIHNPSDHHMRDWSTNFREDKHFMERLCEHGVGHPDPDDLAWRSVSDQRSLARHECCRERCCSPLTAHDIAYERAQASEAWQRMGGGGL